MDISIVGILLTPKPIIFENEAAVFLHGLFTELSGVRCESQTGQERRQYSRMCRLLISQPVL